MSDDSGRISVSRDALRAELAKLELRLVEKLVTKTDHEDLAHRVTGLEEQAARLRGALAILSLIFAVAVAAVAHYAG